ncbi:hypothetical protein HZC08_01530 [Candidatus Micrarchaeota archaeon]|nr:hypothetical protein [Candidatus Micrarchaeota archaeon]
MTIGFTLGLVIGLGSLFLGDFHNILLDFIRSAIKLINDVFFIYLILVSLKTMTGFNYVKAVGTAALSFFLLGILTGSIVLGYYYFVVMPAMFNGEDTTDYNFYFNISERADGTMNITHAFIYDSGELKQACYVEFPKGWKQINQSDLKGIFKRLGYSNYDTENLSNYSLTDIFYNSNKSNLSEFIYFQYGFFVGNGAYGECDKTHTSLWLSEWTFNGTIESINQTLSGQNQLELCDSKGKEGNKTRHDFTAGIRYYGIGFSGVYESPYGQDEDLYYILNSIRCYN